MPDRPTVSAYIVCLNEAPRIAAAIRSVAFCDQIVVVDSGSTDGTREVVEGLAAEGLPIEWHENAWPGYAAQKQHALDRCTGEWCLNLDADEVADDGFAERLFPILQTADEGTGAIRVLRHAALYGARLPRGVRGVGQTRIVRRGRGRYDLRQKVHEGLTVEGETLTCRDLVIRDERALPMHEQMAKEARYADLKARQLHERGVRPRPLKLLLNPPYVFARQYIGRRLVLAGWAGLARAHASGVYAWLTEVRLMELWREDAHGKADRSEEG